MNSSEKAPSLVQFICSLCLFPFHLSSTEIPALELNHPLHLEVVMGCGLPPCTKRRSAQKPQDTAVRLSPARRAWRARVGLLLEKPSWSGPGLGRWTPQAPHRSLGVLPACPSHFRFRAGILRCAVKDNAAPSTVAVSHSFTVQWFLS